MSTPATIAEFDADGITARDFHETILPAARPVIFREIATAWPVVRAGRQSDAALCDYLRRFDRGQSVRAMLGPPRINGRFFYDEDLSGFNFRTESVRIDAALDLLLAAQNDQRPTSLAIQSVPVFENLSGFERENRMKLLPETVEPRVWIGNRVTVAAHYDPSENIAVCAAGRRTFTLFPPEQVANLYPGPFELTPAGPTISMVDFDVPDLARFPRFATALAAAITVQLEPGDALYIPYLWWHHVRSTAPLNMLVNYWWSPAAAGRAHPVEAMLHAMLAIKNLPDPHRAAWERMFRYYVFRDDGQEPGAHLPAPRRGAQGMLGPEEERELRGALARSLSRP